MFKFFLYLTDFGVFYLQKSAGTISPALQERGLICFWAKMHQFTFIQEIEKFLAQGNELVKRASLLSRSYR
jgi:hypothetical protein